MVFLPFNFTENICKMKNLFSVISCLILLVICDFRVNAQKPITKSGHQVLKDSIFYSASAMTSSSIGLALTTDRNTRWIEYHNTIANQPLANYVFLEGTKEIGLYMTVPKDSAGDYRYSILEDDKNWLAIDSKPITFLDQPLSNATDGKRRRAKLGQFNVDGKKLTIECYNINTRNKVTTTTIYNKVINPAELYLATFEIVTKDGDRAVEMKNQNDGFKFKIKDKVTISNILLSIKPTDVTFIYYVYLRNISSGKIVQIGNSWNYGYIGDHPHLLIDASYFANPGDYEVAIMPKLSSGFNAKSFPGKATKINFTVLKSESLYSQREILFLCSGLILIAALITAILFVIQKRSHSRKVQAEQERKKHAEMQLNAIRSQLNPHFVFNALSGIQSLMNNHETDQANRYLAKFARLTRNILKNSELVSLAEEISLLEDFLEMERLRFGFQYTIKVDPELQSSDSEIPAMLLQPLVENAVRHGVAELGQNGIIAVEMSKQESRLVILIKDNGKGFDVDQANDGLGLTLTKSRIALFNGIHKDSPISLHMNSGFLNTEAIVTLNNWL